MAYDSKERLLLIDVESLVFICSLQEDVEEGKFLVDERLRQIIGNVERNFNITKSLLFFGGKDNFRRQLYTDYKANRKLKPNNFRVIAEYAMTYYECIIMEGGEADDGIFTVWNEFKDSIMVSIDKDLKSNCYGSFFNLKGDYSYVFSDQANFNFAMQMIVGDSADNIKGCPGLGPIKAERYVKLGMSPFSYRRAVYRAYRYCFGSKAKEQFILNYLLLKLHTPEEIKKIRSKYLVE